MNLGCLFQTEEPLCPETIVNRNEIVTVLKYIFKIYGLLFYKRGLWHMTTVGWNQFPLII
jgi:hypothetical protein